MHKNRVKQLITTHDQNNIEYIFTTKLFVYFFDRQDTAQCFAREVSFLEWKSTEEILQAGAWK